MKTEVKILSLGAAVLGAQGAIAQQEFVQGRDLHNFGISFDTVAVEFEARKGVTLKLNDMIGVSSDAKGAGVRFETLDQISIVVPLDTARGCPNKWPGCSEL